MSLDVCLSCVRQKLVTLVKQYLQSEECLPMGQYWQQSVEKRRRRGKEGGGEGGD